MTACLFTLLVCGTTVLGRSYEDGDPNPGNPPPNKIVEWVWDDGYPKVTGCGPAIYDNLELKGKLYFLDNLGSVKDDSYFYVYVGTPPSYPVDKSREPKAKIGPKTQSADGKRWYYTVEAKDTPQFPEVNPYGANSTAKCVPLLYWSLNNTNHVLEQFDPAGYATIK